MKKNEKKYILKELKNELEIAALIATSAVTGLTVVGCGSNKKKEDTVINNYIVSEDKHTDVTTPVTTIETTMTTLRPINLDPTKRKYVGGKKTVDSENVDASYENDLAISTTITSVMDSNMNNIDDNNTRIKNNTKINPTTTKITNKAAIKPITSKTTTISESTTEVVTESPVTEPVKSEYNINDICYDVNAFNYFADRLSVDLRTAGDGSFYPLVQFDSNYSNLRCEASYLLALLNYNSINDDVIAEVLSQFSSDSINSCIDFAYNLGSYQADLNNRINFYAYACDQCKYAAEYVNNVQGNFFDGNIGAFVEDQIYNNNIDPLYSGSLSVRCFIAGYTSSYAFLDDYVNSLNDYDDYIHNRVLGNSFSIN